MTPTPYIFFNGQCRAATEAYARIFGIAIPEYMTMEGAPPDMEIPEDRKNWIMHCQMDFGGGTIMMSDDFAGNSPAMDGCNIAVAMPTADESKAVFDQLAEGGDVRMPWEPTFWSPGFGTLTDKFGIRWMIDTDAPEG
ncbi:VOC family protein [Yoonia sp. 208BN28-4]|uniref:VOC family protein n=1 Tax=Yoonia sp. 208BN28-4 TaxID=3126505 RepID=UPI0030B1A4C8